MLPPWSCPPSALLSALGESPPLPAGRVPSVAVSVDEFRQLVPTDVAPAADENMGNLTVIDQLVNVPVGTQRCAAAPLTENSSEPFRSVR